jgi:hypothetical protein
MAFNVELQGMNKVKDMVRDMGVELSASQFRSTLDFAGRLIVSEAKRQENYPGVIGEDFKKDLGVYRDNRKSAKNVEWILVGPRFKNYTISGKEQKVTPIAQHITTGFKQTDRTTKAGQRRGRVKYIVSNPMKDALNAKKNEVNGAILKGAIKSVNKIKSKHGV